MRSLRTQPINFVVAEKYHIDWLRDDLPPQRGKTAHNWVKLSQGYVDMIKDRPVPVDLRILAKLSKPMSIDIYAWLTKRVYGLSRPLNVSWESLYQQFGSSTKELRKFKQTFREALQEVISVYQCKVMCGKKFVTVYPSSTSIPTVTQTREMEWEQKERERAEAESRKESKRSRKRVQIRREAQAKHPKADRQFGVAAMNELVNLLCPDPADANKEIEARRRVIELKKQYDGDFDAVKKAVESEKEIKEQRTIVVEAKHFTDSDFSQYDDVPLLEDE